MMLGHGLRVLALVLLAASLGLSQGFWREDIPPFKEPPRPEWSLTWEEWLAVKGETGLVIDARHPEAVVAGDGYPGAIPLWAEGWDEHFPDFFSRWVPGMPVLVYCDSASCDQSEWVRSRLLEFLGPDEPVYILAEGLDGLPQQ